MKRLKLFVALLLMVASAACGVEVPSGSDWCFHFYFKYNIYESEITNGSWVFNHGLQTDEDGLLTLSYVNPSFIVVPTAVVVKVVRGEGTSGDIHVVANAEIFGIESDGVVDETLPGDQNDAEITFTPENAGDGSTHFNLSVQAEQTMLLESMTVYGNGDNPFGNNNCHITVTPVPSYPFPTATGTLWTPTPTNTFTPSPTLTPSWTFTPSPTLTPTETFTPSPTPDGTWCVLFDFTVGDADFNGDVGGGWSGGTQPHQVDGTGFVDGIVTRGFAGESQRGLNVSRAMFDEEDEQELTFIALYADATTGTNIPDFLTTWGIYDNAGVALEEEELAPDESPTSPLTWIGDDFFSGNLFFGTYNSGLSYRNDSSTPDGEGAITKIVMGGIGAVNPFQEFIDDHGADGFFECLPEPTPTPTNTPTRTPTRTPNPDATGTLPPLLISGTPATRTPTPGPTNTRVRIIVPTPTPYAVGTLPASTTPFPTGTHITTSTPLYTATVGTPGASGTPFDEPWATSVGPGGGGGLGGGTGDGVGGAGGLAEGSGCTNSGLVAQICAVMSSASNAMQQGVRWVGQATGRASALITAYQNAPPIALPGLPHCATDRFGSELCAIYYILSWTILSGPIGSQIVPVAVIDVDIVILFTFLKLSRSILARLAGILRQ